MFRRILLSGFIVCCIFITASGNYDPFADNILFNLNWPGTIELESELDDTGASPKPVAVGVEAQEDDANGEDEVLVMTTKDKEQYQCIIPSVNDVNRKGSLKSYKGPAELELLNPLFKQTSCSYRIESYWTYELCHGRFLRQYHEEKEPGKKVNLQEYYLGYYSIKENAGPEASTEGESGKAAKSKAPIQKVEGLEISYFAVNFTEGTKCDLTGTPRRVSLHYVCQPEGKGEIYTLKEVSTCEYEVVVLTNQLCKHPLYEIKKEPVNQIKCHSVDRSPSRPRSLDNLQLENTQGRYNRRSKLPEKHPLLSEPETLLPKKDRTYHEKRPVPRPDTPISATADRQLLAQFLSGDYCIQGGSGWWKHEFCYGKKITQFHEDKDGKIVILLGKWNQDLHMGWLNDNPSKKPKPVGQRKSLVHYYGSGDGCDQTGQPRWTEVKLRCQENSNHPHSVAIYLMEPATCEYTLVVESPILCPLVDQADEYGIKHQ